LLPNNCKTIYFQVLLGACSQLITSESDLAVSNFTVPYGKLKYTDVAVLSVQFTCTAAGVFPDPANCSSYYVCVCTGCGTFLLSQGTCVNSNFDPVNLECSSTYVCAVCEGPGFLCINNSTFTLCAAAGVLNEGEYPCPSGYYCNHTCVSPCLNYIPDC
jgi:hypothetical protein